MEITVFPVSVVFNKELQVSGSAIISEDELVATKQCRVAWLGNEYDRLWIRLWIIKK